MSVSATLDHTASQKRHLSMGSSTTTATKMGALTGHMNQDNQLTVRMKVMTGLKRITSQTQQVQRFYG